MKLSIDLLNYFNDFATHKRQDTIPQQYEIHLKNRREMAMIRIQKNSILMHTRELISRTNRSPTRLNSLIKGKSR